MVSDWGSVFFLVKLFILEEVSGDGFECFSGPGEEPVDTSAGNQAREVSASDTQGVSGGAHGEHYMKGVSGFVDKVLPQVLFGFNSSCFTELVSDSSSKKSVLLVFREECRHHPNGKHVVDEF